MKLRPVRILRSTLGSASHGRLVRENNDKGLRAASDIPVGVHVAEEAQEVSRKMRSDGGSPLPLASMLTVRCAGVRSSFVSSKDLSMEVL